MDRTSVPRQDASHDPLIQKRCPGRYGVHAVPLGAQLFRRSYSVTVVRSWRQLRGMGARSVYHLRLSVDQEEALEVLESQRWRL